MGQSSSSDVDMNSTEAEFIKTQLSQNCVVMFSKTYCSYCRACKTTLDKLNVDYKVIELDRRSDGNTLQDILCSMTGARTVPRVFINGNSVGGNSETQSLYRSGKLAQMIEGCQSK